MIDKLVPLLFVYERLYMYEFAALSWPWHSVESETFPT